MIGVCELLRKMKVACPVGWKVSIWMNSEDPSNTLTLQWDWASYHYRMDYNQYDIARGINWHFEMDIISREIREVIKNHTKTANQVLQCVCHSCQRGYCYPGGDVTAKPDDVRPLQCVLCGWPARMGRRIKMIEKMDKYSTGGGDVFDKINELVEKINDLESSLLTLSLAVKETTASLKEFIKKLGE